MVNAITFFQSLPLAIRFALREMRGGLGGFYIFILCILLGTGAIAGVNSVAQSMTQAIHAKGQFRAQAARGQARRARLP
jgi:putative ABC transport system permease protein